MSSSSTLPAVALAHSVNSSGRMGLFVDSASCSCSGCSEYDEEMAELRRNNAADAVLCAEPAPVSGPLRLGGGYPVSLQRSAANQIWDGTRYLHLDSDAGRALTGQSSASAVPLSLPPRTSTALPRLSFVTPPAPTVIPPSPSPSVEDETEATMDTLRGLRATLQVRQDRVYDGADLSHSDMAVADAEFDDLDRKIMAIEHCLSAFRAIFRTR